MFKNVDIRNDKFNQLLRLGKKIPGPLGVGVANEDSWIGNFCTRSGCAIYNTLGPSIAAVIIDMTMPVLGGMPTMREMVKMNPDVRIIAASGIHDNEKVAESIGRQVKQFLAKPFTSEMLLKAVSIAVAGS